MSKWDDIKQFSKRTGITDPALDTFIRGEETDKESLLKYSTMKGISDPRVDYWLNKREEYIHSGGFYGIDWDESLWPSREPYDQISRAVYPDSEARWQYSYPGYRPHAVQRRFYENYRSRRRDWVLSGISAWDSDETKPKPDGEEIDLVAIDEARETNSADSGLVEQLEANINRLHDGFRSQFYGGFGGMICHATREYENYVDGRWRETPLKLQARPAAKLPKSTSDDSRRLSIFECSHSKETLENWENPAFPAWLETYR